MLKYLNVLMVVSAVPLLTYLLDGYYQKNIVKGIKYIGVFLLTTLIATIVLYALGLKFVVVLPILIIAFAFLFRKRKI